MRPLPVGAHGSPDSQRADLMPPAAACQGGAGAMAGAGRHKAQMEPGGRSAMMAGQSRHYARWLLTGVTRPEPSALNGICSRGLFISGLRRLRHRGRVSERADTRVAHLPPAAMPAGMSASCFASLICAGFCGRICMDKREAGLPVDGMQESGSRAVALHASPAAIVFLQTCAVDTGCRHPVQAAERQQGRPWFSYGSVLQPVTL